MSICRFDHPSMPFVEWGPCTPMNPCANECIPFHDCCDSPMGLRGYPHKG